MQKGGKRTGIGKGIKQGWKHDQEKERDNVNEEEMRQRKDQAGGIRISSGQNRKEKNKGELEDKINNTPHNELGWRWKCDSPSQEGSQEISEHWPENCELWFYNGKNRTFCRSCKDGVEDKSLLSWEVAASNSRMTLILPNLQPQSIDW